MKKIFISIILTVILATVFSVGIMAAASGYTFDSDATTRTNIKWTVTEEGEEKICTFEIDPTSTNKASTIIYGVDPITGVKSGWGIAMQGGWGATVGVTKIVIGDGITGITTGFLTNLRSVKLLEIPKSFVSITGGSVFDGATALSSIYITGTEPKEGVFDLSNITTFGWNGYLFDSCVSCSSIIFNPDLVTSFSEEFIKNIPLLTELTLPVGIKTLADTSLSKTDGLEVLTVLGNDTVIQSEKVFNGNKYFPAIKANVGSKAEEFAKANGFTFIDLATGETVKGTRPAPGSVIVEEEPKEEEPPENKAFNYFDPDDCTDYGYITGTESYFDAYWVYYEDIKTLKIFPNKTSGWMETGQILYCEDKVGWKPYIDNIEIAIIGPGIHKVSENVFADHTALKEVVLGKSVIEIGSNAFKNCSSLRYVYIDGTEKVEGRADLSKVIGVSNMFTGSAITEVLLSKSTIKINATLGFNMKTIYAHTLTEELIAYAKENSYNLVNVNNPEDKYEYYVEVPAGVIPFGDKCAYHFDEATGTLTIYGSGAIWDVINYYGGGSKTSKIFPIKMQIKHVVIGDNITAIGKYAFTQCENLETVQIPDSESFVILNGAFEKCTNLKSIYRKGTEPIIGTADLRNVHTIEPWTLAYDYLIANVIISDKAEKFKTSVFEENVNLAGIYSLPGSYAEEFATKNEIAFYDMNSATPIDTICTIPETTETEAPETIDKDTQPLNPVNTEQVAESIGGNEDTGISLVAPESNEIENNETKKDNDKIKDDEKAGSVDGENSSTSSMLIIIVVIVLSFAICTVIIVAVILKKKK